MVRKENHRKILKNFGRKCFRKKNAKKSRFFSRNFYYKNHMNLNFFFQSERHFEIFKKKFWNISKYNFSKLRENFVIKITGIKVPMLKRSNLAGIRPTRSELGDRSIWTWKLCYIKKRQLFLDPVSCSSWNNNLIIIIIDQKSAHTNFWF